VISPTTRSLDQEASLTLKNLTSPRPAANQPATSSGGTAQSPTSGSWPNGEPQSIRDAADRKK
jgi:hypothetical protein